MCFVGKWQREVCLVRKGSVFGGEGECLVGREVLCGEVCIVIFFLNCKTGVPQ